MEREEAMCEADRLKKQAEAFEEMISEVPFRYRAGESKISIFNRSPKVEISQEQPPDFSGVLLAKPDTIFSGEKRKAITLIEEVADKPSLSSAPVKNVTEWNCELCQVCTTSQDGLNDHLQGKKHKRKVAALREHKDDKYCSIGLLPKKPKLMHPMERPSDDLLSGEKLEEGSSATNDNDPPSLLIDDSANDLRKNAAHEKQDNKEFPFWCDTCQIGTFSEIVMESHTIGKKHKRKTKTAALLFH
uniref:U1-type domain-containing protein n=1 Tax=Solanum tuberosum TaxID=4113 RepID=M1DKT0_SOLTU